MNIKNKEFVVQGMQNSPIGSSFKDLHVIITNDRLGKTLSIDNGTIQFTIPMDDIAKYLK